MQMMRHGDVNGVHLGIREQFAMIGGNPAHTGHLPKPVEQLRLQVAYGGELRPDGKIGEREPTGESGRRFAAHEAAADDSDADGKV